MTNDTADDRSDANDFMKAISAFRDIESMLHEDEETIKIPIRDIIVLLPDDDVSVEESDAVPDDKIALKIDSLFYQLSKGKVEVSVSDLAAALPAEFIRPQALDDDQTMVRLPLQMVVKAIDPAVWAEKMALKTSRHKAMDIPDPFAPKLASPPDAGSDLGNQLVPEPSGMPESEFVDRPSEITESDSPDLTPVDESVEVPSELAESHDSDEPSSAETSADTVPEAADKPDDNAEPLLPAEPSLASMAPPATVLESVRSAAAETPTLDDASQMAEHDDVGGVNLNTATREQLMTLDGVTELVADSILKYRQEAGRFNSVFELAAIPRVGRKTFRKMTGMPYSVFHRHRRLRLARLLRKPPEALSHVPDVARAVAALPWVSGCVIANSEGVLLAEHGTGNLAEKLGAVMPTLMRRTRDSVALLEMGPLASVSFSLGSRMVTAALAGDAAFAVVHARASLSQSQWRLIHKLAAELAWLLSHRAYAGRG